MVGRSGCRHPAHPGDALLQAPRGHRGPVPRPRVAVRRGHGHEPSRGAQLRLAQQSTLETRDGKAAPQSLATKLAVWRQEATAIIEAFLTEPFSNDERHVRRIAKIAAYERTGEVVE